MLALIKKTLLKSSLQIRPKQINKPNKIITITLLDKIFHVIDNFFPLQPDTQGIPDFSLLVDASIKCFVYNCYTSHNHGSIMSLVKDYYNTTHNTLKIQMNDEIILHKYTRGNYYTSKIEIPNSYILEIQAALNFCNTTIPCEQLDTLISAILNNYIEHFLKSKMSQSKVYSILETTFSNYQTLDI